jgi:GNAT superfamily N-acetyltransferase
VEAFDCGVPALYGYLHRHALPNQNSGAGRTYVALSGEEIIGYFTLVTAQVEHADAPERLSKGLGRYPIPLMLLARLAVTREKQGKGLGAGLLKNAMHRTLAAAEIAGIRALGVDAKDDGARRFYEHYQFVSSPADPYRLFLLLKEVRLLLA